MVNDIPAPPFVPAVPSLLIADAIRVFDIPATVAVAGEKGQEVARALAAAGQNNADVVAKILGEAADDSIERLARTAALFGAAIHLFENGAQDVIRHNARVALASLRAGREGQECIGKNAYEDEGSSFEGTAMSATITQLSLFPGVFQAASAGANPTPLTDALREEIVKRGEIDDTQEERITIHPLAPLRYNDKALVF